MKTIALYKKPHVVCDGVTYGFKLFSLYLFFGHDPCNFNTRGGIQDVEWNFKWGDVSWGADVRIPFIYDGQINVGIVGSLIGNKMFDV